MRYLSFTVLWGVVWILRRLGLVQGRKFRLLSPFPRLSGTREGLRVLRINGLLNRMASGATYLEIGTSYGSTLQAVVAKAKVGVDPNSRFNVRLTPPSIEIHNLPSDVFFANCQERFDFIYLDGLHEAKQTYRDLINALNALNEGGLILIDDVLPTDLASSLPSEQHASELKKKLDIKHSNWFGDVYKVVKAVLDFHPELGLGVFGNAPGDHGQALVWRQAEVAVRAEPVNIDFDQITFKSVFGGADAPRWEEDLSLAEPGSAHFILPTRF